ncbi:MAG: cobalt-precorrin 5A hydrolase [Lachnospiraceae bacterium]
MKIGIINFTISGHTLGIEMAKKLAKSGHETYTYTKSKFASDESAEFGEVSVAEWTKRGFEEYNALIYIGACAIAVRSIAPFLRGKTQDPAVLVIDEMGRYVISLLSGHIGGANELALEVAAAIGAKPIITTATDINGKFAVDVFAKKNQCYISDMKAAKMVSAALLAGEPVGFYSDYPWEGEVPECLQLYQPDAREKPEIGIVVSDSYRAYPFTKTLYLVPKVVSVGIGCRQGTQKAVIENAIRDICNQYLIPSIAIEYLASIDLKAQEPGIHEYCEERKIPFVTYGKEELEALEGTFTPSEFVESITGVDNVCERSAVMASKQGRLFQKKWTENGVAIALAVKEWSVHFE